MNSLCVYVCVLFVCFRGVILLVLEVSGVRVDLP